jgi:hypothetical protein
MELNKFSLQAPYKFQTSFKVNNSVALLTSWQLGGVVYLLGNNATELQGST